MTIDQFIDQLSVTRKGEWYLHGFGSDNRNRIRVGSRDDYELRQCPLSAVAGLMGVQLLQPAKQLGLSVPDAMDIANAADHRPNAENAALRIRLLQATGLVGA